jgi:hypothetical protein
VAFHRSWFQKYLTPIAEFPSIGVEQAYSPGTLRHAFCATNQRGAAGGWQWQPCSVGKVISDKLRSEASWREQRRWAEEWGGE